MKVCEIFTSIQGESSYAGLPCTFVRLTGCNLQCVYCDTEYAFHEGIDMTLDEIVSHVILIGVNLVEITGGEPLIQGEDTLRLVRRLLDEGLHVLVETNGSLSIRDIDKRAIVILDIKTPGSCMDDRNDFSNFHYLKPADEVKFVICSRQDYEWAKGIIEEHRLRDKCIVLFSPTLGMMDPQQLAQWIIEERLDVRFNLQIHKYLFGPDRRAV